MPESLDPLRAAAPEFADLEAQRARAGVAAALFGSSEPVEPVRVGRYRIDGRIGAGGMGVVYRAHDPDLDRPVAVKLLRSEATDDHKARARMLREARALAKLSHPNVITVFDVGTVVGDDGSVFVAMELVAGKDLRRWLASEGSDAHWRAVLDRFIAAGRGLEAAHRAGLIHRDFKPENVLVGDDGRVRVLDFGLARLHRSLEEATYDRGQGPAATGEQAIDPDDPSRAPTLGDSAELDPRVVAALGDRAVPALTETGALLGTPLYMAPELYDGRPADTASDQFAFCCSLYEGLYGRRPYDARGLAAHVEAVRTGRVVEPPADSPVPIALYRALRRGLEPDPAARHVDMRALLDELEEIARVDASSSAVGEPRRAGWTWIFVVLLVLSAVIGIVGLELGWFGSEGPGQRIDQGPPEPSGEPADASEAPVRDPDEAASTSSTTGTGPEATGDPDQAIPEPEAITGAEAPKPPEQPEVAADPPASPSEDPAGHDWCHLHEDRYTLLARSPRRRATLLHEGTCYECRIERRSSRTQNFSPRDCAGYSLCGATTADACQ